MTDLRATIIPKSDQMNSDDLIGGPVTIKVANVSLLKEAEQPIAINYEGDGGKPYKPCKSMRRVMVTAWGPDGNAYKGRSMILYRDPAVLWGGQQVGGIRISHMSDIKEPMTMALTATKQSRKPFTVRPLIMEKDGMADKVADGVDELVRRITAASDEGRKAIVADPAVVKQRAWLVSKRPDLAARVDAAVAAVATPDDPDAPESMNT